MSLFFSLGKIGYSVFVSVGRKARRVSKACIQGVYVCKVSTLWYVCIVCMYSVSRRVPTLRIYPKQNLMNAVSNRDSYLYLFS